MSTTFTIQPGQFKLADLRAIWQQPFKLALADSAMPRSMNLLRPLIVSSPKAMRLMVLTQVLANSQKPAFQMKT